LNAATALRPSVDLSGEFVLGAQKATCCEKVKGKTVSTYREECVKTENCRLQNVVKKK